MDRIPFSPATAPLFRTSYTLPWIGYAGEGRNVERDMTNTVRLGTMRKTDPNTMVLNLQASYETAGHDNWLLETMSAQSRNVWVLDIEVFQLGLGQWPTKRYELIHDHNTVSMRPVFDATVVNVARVRVEAGRR